MKRLKVVEVNKLPDIKGGHVFNSRDFQSLKEGESKHFVVNDESDTLCRISYGLVDNAALSGYQATFGSFDFTVDQDLIKLMIKETSRNIFKSGVELIRIKHWPLGYPEGELIHRAFISAGFEIESKEVNQHLVINEEEFIDRIKKNEKKKLKQSHNEKFQFKMLDGSYLLEVYNLVKDTRERKGFPVSMSFNELEKVFNKLPDNYHLFGVFDEDVLIAASVSIRISEKILYNFYHADLLDYRSRSPLVMLNEGIYNYCKTENIKLLDLGISSENGELNEGLFTFKENLGCATSDKNTYVLKNVKP
ncbi:MAG: hypothetical protein ABFS32_00880 [Bacteroidota bacterium]